MMQRLKYGERNIFVNKFWENIISTWRNGNFIGNYVEVETNWLKYLLSNFWVCKPFVCFCTAFPTTYAWKVCWEPLLYIFNLKNHYKKYLMQKEVFYLLTKYAEVKNEVLNLQSAKASRSSLLESTTALTAIFSPESHKNGNFERMLPLFYWNSTKEWQSSTRDPSTLAEGMGRWITITGYSIQAVQWVFHWFTRLISGWRADWTTQECVYSWESGWNRHDYPTWSSYNCWWTSNWNWYLPRLSLQYSHWICNSLLVVHDGFPISSLLLKNNNASSSLKSGWMHSTTMTTWKSYPSALL